jgi:DNA-directed RNA polymerase subunit RPC12/RpoP
MIHFSCMYCGRKLWAKDRLLRMRIKCPACGHKIRIRPADRKRSPDAGSTRTQDWQCMSDREIARELREAEASTGYVDRRLMMRQALSPFMPHYDSLTLFALSSAFILLLLLGPGIKPPPALEGRASALLRVAPHFVAFVGFLIPLAGIGMVLSLVGVFYTKPKPDAVKWLMLCFAVVVTAGTGIYAGFIWFTTTHGWLVVFPAWNVLNATIPLVLFREGLLDTELIVDTVARFWQVAVTLVVTTAIVALCVYYFRLHWAITYSICVSYTMSLNHAITDVFGGGEIAEEAQQSGRDQGSGARGPRTDLPEP